MRSRRHRQHHPILLREAVGTQGQRISIATKNTFQSNNNHTVPSPHAFRLLSSRIKNALSITDNSGIVNHFLHLIFTNHFRMIRAPNSVYTG